MSWFNHRKEKKNRQKAAEARERVSHLLDEVCKEAEARYVEAEENYKLADLEGSVERKAEMERLGDVRETLNVLDYALNNTKEGALLLTDVDRRLEEIAQHMKEALHKGWPQSVNAALYALGNGILNCREELSPIEKRTETDVLAKRVGILDLHLKVITLCENIDYTERSRRLAEEREQEAQNAIHEREVVLNQPENRLLTEALRYHRAHDEGYHPMMEEERALCHELDELEYAGVKLMTARKEIDQQKEIIAASRAELENMKSQIRGMHQDLHMDMPERLRETVAALHKQQAEELATMAQVEAKVADEDMAEAEKLAETEVPGAELTETEAIGAELTDEEVDEVYGKHEAEVKTEVPAQEVPQPIEAPVETENGAFPYNKSSRRK